MDQGQRQPGHDDAPQGLPREWRVDMPSSYLFTSEDFLEVDSICSVAGVTLTITGAMLAPPLELRPFSFTQAPASNRTVVTTRVSCDSGWLAHMRVAATAGAPLFGQCYVFIRVCRGSTVNALVLGTIAAGYVTANTDLFFPNEQTNNPLDGAGAIRSITGGVPAAGANISEVVPTGARWELISFTFALTTAVAAANRVVALTIDDGANVYSLDTPSFVQIASLTDNYSFGNSQSKVSAPAAPFLIGSLPGDNRLLAGHRIRTSTVAIQAADQFTAPQYLVREWLEGN